MPTRKTTIALLAVAALTGCANIVRDRLYKPPTDVPPRAALAPDVRDVTVTASDGVTLRGFDVPGRPDKPVLLFFHGNASSAAGVTLWLRPLLDRGYGFVSAEYRGYAGNAGAPTQAGLARDADAFLAHARALAGTRPVYVVGHSLGAGVAFDLALRHRLDALVTIGAFASVRDMAPKVARAFVPDPFDNRAAAARLDEPLFLLHGEADAVVSPQNGNEIGRAANSARAAGGAVVLVDQGHQPDAALLADVFDAITANPATPPLPPKTRWVPFAAR